MSSCYLATMVDNLADKVNECLLIRVIVASLSEPHTSKLNMDYSYIYIYIYIYMPYVRCSVNASLHSFNPKHVHTDPRRKRC